MKLIQIPNHVYFWQETSNHPIFNTNSILKILHLGMKIQVHEIHITVFPESTNFMCLKEVLILKRGKMLVP